MYMYGHIQNPADLKNWLISTTSPASHTHPVGIKVQKKTFVARGGGGGGGEARGGGGVGSEVWGLRCERLYRLRVFIRLGKS